MLRSFLLLSALVAAASAQTRFEICSHANPDCSGAVRCGSDRDDGDSCASNGVPGVGVRATCADNVVTLFDETDCSGEMVSEVVAPGACVAFEITGDTYYITNNCTGTSATVAPTAAATAVPTTDAPESEAPTDEPTDAPSPMPSAEASLAPVQSSEAEETPDGNSATTPDSTSAAEGTTEPEDPAAATFSDPAVTETPEDDDDGSVCFDSQSTVLLEDGSQKTLDAVVPGDFVQSVDSAGEQTFSEVFLVQHAGVSKTVKMIDLVHETGTLRVTPSHYLRTAGETEGYVAAGKLSVGDKVVLGCMCESEILDIVASRGSPRNVHTMNDRIVVDGIAASCVSANPLLGLDAMHFRMLLAPLKMMYRAGFSGIVNTLDQAVYRAYNFGKST